MARVIAERSAPPPAPPPKVLKVILDISENEAVFIAAVLGNMRYGHPGQGVYEALQDEGLGYGHERYNEFQRMARDL